MVVDGAYQLSPSNRRHKTWENKATHGSTGHGGTGRRYIETSLNALETETGGTHDTKEEKRTEVKEKGPLAHGLEEETPLDLDTDAASTVILNDRYKLTVTCVTYVGKNATLEKLAISLLLDS